MVASNARDPQTGRSLRSRCPLRKTTPGASRIVRSDRRRRVRTAACTTPLAITNAPHPPALNIKYNALDHQPLKPQNLWGITAPIF